MEYPITDRLRCNYGGTDRSGKMEVILPTPIMLEAATEIESLRNRLAAAEQENTRLGSLLYGGRCVYCGEVVGVDTLNQDLSDEVLKEHIKTCAAHPYVQMKDRAEAAEKERDELLEWKKGVEDRLCEATLSLAEMVRVETERDELRAENAEFLELIAEVRDSFPVEDERIDRGIRAGVDGCPKSALLWVAEEITLLVKENERLNVDLGNAEFAASIIHTDYQALESALTAAQQSAKEQFVAGAGKACEVIRDHDESLDLGDYAVSILCAAIREAAKEGSK